MEEGRRDKWMLMMKKMWGRTSSEIDKEDKRDRLSELPDFVLLHILKFMDTTYAVRTCILSKRWKDLWKHLTSFTFIFFYFRSVQNFNRFVSEVLSRRDHSLSLLDLHFQAYPPTASQHLNMVIKYVVWGNVQRLTIETASNCFVPLIFSCPTLVILKLSVMLTCPPLKLPKSLQLPALKSLHLANVIFTASNNDDCAEPFSTCTLLNTLVLVHCTLHSYVKVFYISNSNLSTLKMEDTLRFTNQDSFQRKIVLSTPNLSSLTIMDNFSSRYHQLSSSCSLSFLEEANIVTPSDIDYSAIIRLLQLLTNVKILRLSLHTLVIIQNDLSNLATVRTQPPCFVRLESLVVKMNPYVQMSEMEVNKVVEYVLQNSPQTRVVVMNC